MRNVNELTEIITTNVTSWTVFLKGPILHSSEFLLQFAYAFPHALICNTLSSETESTVPD